MRAYAPGERRRWGRSDVKTYYMHTLDGHPASMDSDGSQLVFVNGVFKARLCRSLREIRRQRRRSQAWRDERGLRDDSVQYGHILVTIGDE